MRVTHLTIDNFRSIRHLELELAETTVLIGPNNAGKTAILDALRIALTRRWGVRGSGFNEYDVHLADENADPKAPPGVGIEVRAQEQTPGEWPDELLQDLDRIIQLDPKTDTNSVTLRVGCAWDTDQAVFQPSWQFLNAARAPLVGEAARRTNLERFWLYLPVFHLGPLRDISEEFSPRSQFWGRLLTEMEIPAALEKRAKRVLDLLNKKLLDADPRLKQVANTLTGITRVAAADSEGKADLRLLPFKPWDILSRSEIIIQQENTRPWLPLAKQGQGMQSLSVIFLFQAFVQHLLAALFNTHSTPVLALEEPETHLHPQAARSLWMHIQSLPGQKILTTHSPYFVQHVPFRQLRLVRLEASGTTVNWLPSQFTVHIPHVPALDDVVTHSAGKLSYVRASETLSVNGTLDRDVMRDLMRCYGTHAQRGPVTSRLGELRRRSTRFISDADLSALETYARRIRGEIFFARRWLLVEGPAEYLLAHAIAKVDGYDLDEHGVSVIDTMNNGNPQAFAALARSLSIPWTAVFDNDDAGKSYLADIRQLGFAEAEVGARCRLLQAGHLEDQLLADGLEPVLRELLVTRCGLATAADADLPDLLAILSNRKRQYAAELAQRLREEPNLVGQMPAALRTAIASLKDLK
jgi:putative ATP-dependent endonuclease of the OLD family